MRTDIDGLVMETFVLEKSQQPASAVTEDQHHHVELD
jgi:hypothetical protein